MMEMALAQTVGETRTIASIAASKGWRGKLLPTQQVRVELLRRYAAENPMGDEARREQGYTSPNAWLWRDHSNGRVPEPA